MTKQITLREAITKEDISVFWEQLHAYHRRDIFPNLKDEEDLAYFLDDTKYRNQIQKLHDRPQDRCHYLFFCSGGHEIGFAMMVIYNTEDGKCFLMEFCVYPQFRGGGMGKQCAKAFLEWAAERGASYTELNYSRSKQRFRFWNSLGFLPNGTDEWGEPLMMLPPEDKQPITVELLADPEDWQLMKLENGLLTEVGEKCLTDERKERLSKAAADRKILFFMAKRGSRAVGMCSVATCFSTFSCGATGYFDNFYVEPVFRCQGIARKLAKAAQDWCCQNGVACLTVCCAPCDEEMYQELGFAKRLGSAYTFLC